MGCFPYTCYICGGAYQRCGASGHDSSECEKLDFGRNLCFEDNVVVSVVKDQPYCDTFKSIGKTFDGTYDGYGEVKIEGYENFIFTGVDDLEDNLESGLDVDKGNVVLVQISCKSCFDGMFGGLRRTSY